MEDVKQLQARRAELEKRVDPSQAEVEEMEVLSQLIDEASVEKAQDVESEQMVQIPKNMLDKMMAMQAEIVTIKKNLPQPKNIDDPTGDWEKYKDEELPRTLSLKLYTPEGTRKLYPIVSRTALVNKWIDGPDGKKVRTDFTDITYLDEDGKPHNLEMQLLDYVKLPLRVWCGIVKVNKTPERKPVGETASRYKYDYDNWKASPLQGKRPLYVSRERRTYDVIIPKGNPNDDRTIVLKADTKWTVEDRVANGA